MPEITKAVNSALLDREGLDIADKINQTIASSGIYDEDEIDIELTFTVLNSLSNPRDSIKQLGPYGAYISSFVEEYFDRFDAFPRIDNVPKLRTLSSQTSQRTWGFSCLPFHSNIF